MKDSTALREARLLITPRERWTIGMLAAIDQNTPNVRRCPPTYEKAECFCLEGAVCRVLGVDAYNHDNVPQTIIDALHEEGCRLLAKRDVAEGMTSLSYGERLLHRRISDERTATPYLVNDDLGHDAALEVLRRAEDRLLRRETGMEWAA